MNRPLLLLTVCYIGGILCGEAIGMQAAPALGLAAFCLLLAAIGYVLAWRETRRVLFVLFFCLGLALSCLAAEQSKTPLIEYAGHQVALVGRISAEPDIRTDKIFYLLQVQELVLGEESRAISGTVRLQVKDSDRVYAYGSVIKVSGLLTRPELPGNPGAFNYRTYLERQGIGVVLLAQGEEAVETWGDETANPLLRVALQLKEKLAAAATLTLAPGPATVLNGILFGTQGELDQQTRDAFTETGIVHILSVSGLHIGLILGGLIGLLQILRVPLHWTAPLVSPVLIFYVFMIGFKPSVLRATVMVLLLLWAHHWGRERDWPTTMAVAALLILVWNPLQIYNPGFQLSFAATWGILYLTPHISKICDVWLGKVLPPAGARPVSQALAVTLAAQLATIPLVAWYYNLVSPVSLLVNLVAIPLVACIMLLGFCAAFLGLLWPLLAVIINVSNGILMELFLSMVSFFQALPGAVFYLATPPELVAGAWYGILVLLVWLYTTEAGQAIKERSKSWIPVALALGVALLLVFAPWNNEDALTVHFVDVGQGDCVLVQTPSGGTMLIDTGGRRNEFQTGVGTGAQIVTPYLRKIGVRRLDVLVLTHPDEDHAGGAAAVVKNFPVSLAVVTDTDDLVQKQQNGQNEGEVPPAYVQLLEEMSDSGTRVHCAVVGDTIRLDREITAEVLAPKSITGLASTGLNDRSVVLKLAYRQHSFLFTGDLEPDGQRELLQGGADLRADVLKMPHHGSRFFLPELVTQVDPDIAVISVGAYNNFGHPAPFALETLAQNEVRVYRTDKDGAVIFKTDGNRMEVRTGKSDGEEE